MSTNPSVLGKAEGSMDVGDSDLRENWTDPLYPIVFDSGKFQ